MGDDRERLKREIKDEIAAEERSEKELQEKATNLVFWGFVWVVAVILGLSYLF